MYTDLQEREVGHAKLVYEAKPDFKIKDIPIDDVLPHQTTSKKKKAQL